MCLAAIKSGVLAAFDHFGSAPLVGIPIYAVASFWSSHYYVESDDGKNRFLRFTQFLRAVAKPIVLLWHGTNYDEYLVLTQTNPTLQLQITILVAPIIEEVFFRFVMAVIFRVLQAMCSPVFKQLKKHFPLLEFIHVDGIFQSLFAATSSLTFGLAHCINYLQAAEAVVASGSTITQEISDPIVAAAITHAVLTCALSLLMFVPLYKKHGLIASVAAHMTLNLLCNLPMLLRALAFLISWMRKKDPKRLELYFSEINQIKRGATILCEQVGLNYFSTVPWTNKKSKIHTKEAACSCPVESGEQRRTP